DLVLVPGALADARDEQLPDPVRWMPAHRMSPTVPAVPVADDAHALRVRRPYCEDHAAYAVHVRRVRAELVVDPVVRALAEQMQVVVGERRREAVRVVGRPHAPVVTRDAQPVSRPGIDGQLAGPEPRAVDRRQIVRDLGRAIRDDGHRADAGPASARWP